MLKNVQELMKGNEDWSLIESTAEAELGDSEPSSTHQYLSYVLAELEMQNRKKNADLAKEA